MSVCLNFYLINCATSSYLHGVYGGREPKSKNSTAGNPGTPPSACKLEAACMSQIFAVSQICPVCCPRFNLHACSSQLLNLFRLGFQLFASSSQPMKKDCVTAPQGCEHVKTRLAEGFDARASYRRFSLLFSLQLLRSRLTTSELCEK